MTFRVGQKVVCVDADVGKGASWWICPLKVGQVYTILEIITGAQRKYTGLVVDGDPGVRWAHIRFRPLVERKTDISIFERMLLPQRVEA